MLLVLSILVSRIGSRPYLFMVGKATISAATAATRIRPATAIALNRWVTPTCCKMVSCSRRLSQSWQFESHPILTKDGLRSS